MAEILKIFDEHKNEIGKADRDEVHQKGYWHETFHCWFIEKIEGTDFIYFQKRSEKKKDFPNLLDITAAGHITSNETVKDGIREVQEELGTTVEFEDLISVGVIEDGLVTKNFIDREFAHVFLYHKNPADEFSLQLEEVAGIFKTEFNDFRELCEGDKKVIEVQGFTMDDFGERMPITMNVDLDHFVPHQTEYWKKVVGFIAASIN